jgi:hypothetical protein
MSLIAYFDDSNSHKDAPLILWAGFVGYENQWALLDETWTTILENEGIPYFSWSESLAGRPPFNRFDPSRAWRDHLVFQFRNAILEAGLFGIAAGVPHSHWRELVSPEDERWINPPGTVCLTLVSLKAVRYAKRKNYSAPITVYFDGGVELPAKRSASAVGNILNKLESRHDNYDFASVKATPALQAADLFAGELQNDMKAYLRDGHNRQVSPHMTPWMNRKCDIDFLERSVLAERLASPAFQHVLNDENWTELEEPRPNQNK